MQLALFGNLLNKETSTRAQTTLFVIVPTLLAVAVLDAFVGFHHFVWILFVAALGRTIYAFEWVLLARHLPLPYVCRWLGLLYVCLVPTVATWFILFTNPLWMVWCVVMVSVADVAAYFCGRALRGPLLCPRISPGKTWAGFLGAVIACGLLALLPWGPQELAGKLGASGLVVMTATAGDLFESWLKRNAGVKDSGAFLPGHGGLFDRLDGHIAALPVTALLLWWLG